MTFSSPPTPQAYCLLTWTELSGLVLCGISAPVDSSSLTARSFSLFYIVCKKSRLYYLVFILFQMFDDADNAGPSDPKEDPIVSPRRLLTEEDVKTFLDGAWPVKQDDAEYLDDSNTGEDSDDEGCSSKRRRLHQEDPMATILAGAHFMEAPGDIAEAREIPDPMPFFDMVLPPPVIDMIICCSNQSAEILKMLQMRNILYTNWKPITNSEFKVFLGLLYHMEVIKLSKIKDYWKSTRLYAIPIFQNMMTKTRFLGILGALSFNTIVPPPDEEVLRQDKLYKLRPLLDHFNNLVASLHCPEILKIERTLSKFKANPLFSTYSWYKRLGVSIFHMLLEIGSGIYNEQTLLKKLPFHKFRHRVVEELLPLSAMISDHVIPIQGDKPHYMSYIGINEKGKKRRKRCKYCMDVNNKRKESYFCCSSCANHPGFCIDGCFAKYHGYS